MRGCASSSSSTALLRSFDLPRVQQSLDMPALLRREGNLSEQPPYLGGIVVLDRRLEPFAYGQRLRELTS